MELRQLEYLVAVADEASFTRAAARLHVAQPGVSAQVRRLEAELGLQLLDRSGRTVRPTEVGAAVLAHARAALDAVAGVRMAVDELTGLLRGHVAVGTVTSPPSDLLPDLLAGFHTAHPGVEITLSEGTSDHLLAQLRSGGLDLALVGAAGPPPADIETALLLEEPLAAAVAASDPLVARTGVTLRGLASRPLISLPRGTGLRTAFDDACARAGVQPRIAFEAGVPEVLAQLAARGLGVAILPAGFARAHPELHALPITRPAVRARLELAWRAGGPAGPAARALVAHARGALG